MEDGSHEPDAAKDGHQSPSVSQVQDVKQASNESKVNKEGGENEPEESVIREWFDLFVKAGFWALVLYLFVFQVSVVEGPSMQPNFRTDDRLVIDKMTYKVAAVRRFDVIVFQAVEIDRYVAGSENKDYIKRVIGLPGDHVVLKATNVLINGKALDEPFEFEHICYYGLPEEFVVPPKHYFVMGDNRANSKDSRSTGMGFIPESQIRGVVRLRFWPLNRWNWYWRK